MSSGSTANNHLQQVVILKVNDYMTENAQPAILKRGEATLAYHHTSGTTPGVLFLGGFKSDMIGTKATALEAYCQQQGWQFTRFDYQGHGESSGVFEEGTIGLWKDDALGILDKVTTGPQILVGSSMGGWIALLLMQRRLERIAGLIGIAAAPDFTETLIWDQLTPEEQQSLKDTGVYHAPSCYGEDPYPITWKLIEEGRKHLLLRKKESRVQSTESNGTKSEDSSPREPSAPSHVRDSSRARGQSKKIPIHLIQGKQDDDVPWQTAKAIANTFNHHPVEITLVEDGDHRMSSPEHIKLLCNTLTLLRAELA